MHETSVKKDGIASVKKDSIASVSIASVKKDSIASVKKATTTLVDEYTFNIFYTLSFVDCLLCCREVSGGVFFIDTLSLPSITLRQA